MTFQGTVLGTIWLPLHLCYDLEPISESLPIDMRLSVPWAVFWGVVVAGVLGNACSLFVAMAAPNRGPVGLMLHLYVYAAFWPNVLVGRKEQVWFFPDYGYSIIINFVGWIALASIALLITKILMNKKR